MAYLETFVLMLALAGGAAETHHFDPQVFYTTFSSAHNPALTIKPGDHVVTYTLDSGGVDSAGVQRIKGGNPETGPFYVEGAEPGDTLVVHILKLFRGLIPTSTGFFLHPLLAPLYCSDPGVSSLRGAARSEAIDVAHR